MPNFSIVPCEEVHGTRQENWALSGVTASVDLRVAYDRRYDLINDIILNQRPFPFSPLLLPQSTAINTFNSSGSIPTGEQTIEYNDFAIVSVEYSINSDEGGGQGPQDPVDLVSEEIRPNVEFQTLNYRNFLWDTGLPAPEDFKELKEGEEPGKLQHTMSIVRTLFNRQQIPISFLNLPGFSNDQAYTSRLLGLTFPTETLLFSPQPMRRMITSGGTLGYTLSIEFLYKPQGWNKFWNPRTQSYIEMRRKNEENGNPEEVYKPHPPGDFSDWLF